METSVIELSCGKIRGTVEKTLSGSSYMAFKGIPYSQPPTGDLRFKVSQAIIT